MAPPTPPVPLKDHCSIIYNNVLYVYSPTAFLTLAIEPNTQWKQEPNGVSVTGATCVKGGVDGDNSKPALYVVGGATNSSFPDYPGLQRYLILEKQWETITPIVPVTQNRLYHGSAYMNASSSIVVYGGSQNDDSGPSTETFLIELYPPYRVQAYSSIAPPVVDPILLSWSYDHALLLGGGSTNTQVFTFDPADGWQNLGLTLPAPLPDRSVAQCALFTLDDESKVLETFDMGQSPPLVTRNVLLNPGGQPASFGETVGGSTASSSSSPTTTSSPPSRVRRSVFLSNFPEYNGQFAPTGTRSGFSLAQDDFGLVTIVGGDAADSIIVFNGTGDSWLDANKVVSGSPQTTLAEPKPSATEPQSSSSSSSSSSTPAPSLGSKGAGLTILGAVLGGICGLAAILIILLLWIRSIRKRRIKAEKESRRDESSADKKRMSGERSFEDQGLQPLSQNGQPMGRSPVPSTIVDKEIMGPINDTPVEKLQESYSSGSFGPRLRPDAHVGSGTGFGQGRFKREKSPWSISRPMDPQLGDFKDRPSIELGRATPAAPPAALKLARNISQRKTDEGWAKYFQADGSSKKVDNRLTTVSQSSSMGKGGGFWPGAGVPQGPARSSKLNLRDSSGNTLQAQTVAAASPSLEDGPSHARSKGLKVVQGIPAHISSGDSVSSEESADHQDDDGYEDERVEHAYSSGIPSSVNDQAWTPIGNTWSGPLQRPMRPSSSSISSAYPSGGLPLPTSTSHETSNSSGTKRSSIPSFPMPDYTIRSIDQQENAPSSHPITTNQQNSTGSRPRRPTENGRDYFGSAPGQDVSRTGNTLSWLNLNGDPR